MPSPSSTRSQAPQPRVICGVYTQKKKNSTVDIHPPIAITAQSENPPLFIVSYLGFTEYAQIRPCPNPPPGPAICTYVQMDEISHG